MPGTDVSLSTFQKGQIIHGVSDILKAKRDEIEQGKQIIADLEKIPTFSKHKLGRIKGRVKFLEHFVDLMEQGFIPIPRMEYQALEEMYFHGQAGGWRADLTFDKLPIEAITAIASYRSFFTAFGIAPVRKAERKRDPILIGIIKYGHQEEHFLLGWWRPDMMLPKDLW